MKKFSLTHKLLAVALAFVLVAVSLPDLSWLTAIRLTLGNRKWNSRSSCICRRLRLSRWGQREVLGFQPKIQQRLLLMSLSS